MEQHCLKLVRAIEHASELLNMPSELFEHAFELYEHVFELFVWSMAPSTLEAKVCQKD